MEQLKAIPLLKKQNTVANSQKDNLTILKETHFSNSTDDFSINNGNCTTQSNELPRELDEFFSIELLNKAIGTLPTGKAPGPDGIKNELLKHLTCEYRRELLDQIKSSIKMAHIPACWLNINAIYIKKGGNRSNDNPKSYRPIGLSSAILKLSERLINWWLKNTVLAKGIPHQHAFTLGLSTETAISELVNFLEKAKCNNQRAIVLSIDIEGAFDSVPFDVIKSALIQHGVKQEIVEWLDFLSRNRVITTRVGSESISFRPLEGTTQGGLNGPDLWIICIWAIIFTEAARNSRLSKFADDLTSALMGHDLKILRDILQTCLDDLSNWFSSRGLRISATKSFCMVVNRGEKNKCHLTLF